MRPVIARVAKVSSPSRKRESRVREESCSERRTGRPSIKTTWQPMLSFGIVLANAAASAKARPLAMRGGRRHDAADVRFDDSPVHARSESEVICVDDQAPHRASLAGEENKKRGARFVAASRPPVELKPPALDFLPVSCQSY